MDFPGGQVLSLAGGLSLMKTILPVSALLGSSLSLSSLWPARLPRMRGWAVRMSVFAILALVGAAVPPVQGATDLIVQKLYGRWSKIPTSYDLGRTSGLFAPSQHALACSEAWIVVGAPSAAENSAGGEGAVQVFNAITGVFIRKLLPPLPVQAGLEFGTAVAINGNQLAVGAIGPTGSEAGKVYIYNLANGALLRTLVPAGIGDGGAAGDRFGYSLAFSGDWLVVGAPNDDSFRGSAYFFNLKANTAYKVFGSGGASVGISRRRRSRS